MYHGEVDGLIRVPADRVGLVLQHHLPQRRVSFDVVKHDTAVERGAQQEVGLRRIEPHLYHRVHAPVKGLDREGALVVPDLDHIASSSEQRLRVVAMHAAQSFLAAVLVVRLEFVPSLSLTSLRRPYRRVLRFQGAHRPQSHDLVVPARHEFLLLWHEPDPVHHSLVGQNRVLRGLPAQVPDPEFAVIAAGNDLGETVRVLGEDADAVVVALEGVEERLCENAFQLCGVQCPFVFSGLRLELWEYLLKGVDGGERVAVHLLDVARLRLGVLLVIPADCLQFHHNYM